MTTNLHDKMLAAIDALFSASDGDERDQAEEQLLDVRDEINKYKLAAESLNEGLRLDDWDKIGCVNHDCDKCKALAEQSAQQDSPWCMKMNGCKTKCEDCPDEAPKQPAQTKAERLADELENTPFESTRHEAAAELRLLVSFNKDLMDEVARLQKAVADEREACAKVCNVRAAEYDGFSAEKNASEKLAEAIRARGNT